MAIKKTMDMQHRAEAIIPGVTQLLSKRPDRYSNGVWPSYFSKAKGVQVWDLDDNGYLDMSIGGIGATILGYADDEVDDAVVTAIRSGVSSSLNCYEEVELAETLCNLHPWASHARFSRCGGEAMAMAVRICRAKTGRDVVAFCGYHGWHDWYLAANVEGGDALNGHLMSGLETTGVPKGLAGTAFPFQYNHLDELEKIAEANAGKLAAIVMEPLRSNDPQPEFMQGVRGIADRTGAVLVFDEISAGFRYVTGGAHLVKCGIEPDMAVFSKALGNGYPISAVIGRESVMDAAGTTFISSTNWTERVGPVAALAMLEKHKRENVGQHLVRLGKSVQAGWAALAQKYSIPIHISGMEAMSHFSFEHKDAQSLKAYFIQLMLSRGILASTDCYLMYAHAESDVERYLDACDPCFALLAETMDKGDVQGRLLGAPASVGFKRFC